MSYGAEVGVVYAYLLGGVRVVGHSWGWAMGVGVAAGVVEWKKATGEDGCSVMAAELRQQHNQSYSITNSQLQIHPNQDTRDYIT